MSAECTAADAAHHRLEEDSGHKQLMAKDNFVTLKLNQLYAEYRFE
jgi:hypothetical protein